MAAIILRLPDVKARTGLSRSTLYLRISEGRFPKPISLGGRAVGWIDAEVNQWIDDQIAKRDVRPLSEPYVRPEGNCLNPTSKADVFPQQSGGEA